MRYFKKRALTLILASVLTASVSFAEGQFRDKLSALELRGSDGNNVELVLKTDKTLSTSILPRKIDPETFVIMLSDVDGSSAPSPDISQVSGYIKSVNVSTRAATDSAKGYTKITVKTFGRTELTTSNAIFKPEDANQKEDITPFGEPNRVTDVPAETESDKANADVLKNTDSKYKDLYGDAKEKNLLSEDFLPQKGSTASEENLETEISDETGDSDGEEQFNIEPAQPSTPANTPVSNANTPTQDTTQQFLLLLGVVGVIITSIFIYLKGKGAIDNVIGEKLSITVDDDADKKKKENKDEQKDSKQGKIRKTINKLDSLYPNKQFQKFEVTPSAGENMPEIKDAEPLNIVDLDELFKEQTSLAENSEEADALDEFLSGFSFDDLMEQYEEQQKEENEKQFDEVSYEKVMSSDLKFSSKDIECFKKLLNSEVNEETLNRLGEYLVTNPVAPVNKETRGLLESLVIDYSVYRNIIFTHNDIEIIRKLMSVEIDKDFVNNLKTDTKRTMQAEREIKNHVPNTTRPREVLTLKVRGSLPDMAEEIKKQGDKPIKYGVKPETVYFSKGWDYKELHVTNLPDLKEEIKNYDLENIEYEENGYKENISDPGYDSTNDKIYVSNELPDINDAIKNPGMYMHKNHETSAVDENVLISSLENVQLKSLDEDKNIESSNDNVNNDLKDFEELEIIYDNDSSADSNAIVPDELLEALENDNTVGNNSKIEVVESNEIKQNPEKESKEIISTPAAIERKITKKPEANNQSDELIKMFEEADKKRTEKRESRRIKAAEQIANSDKQPQHPDKTYTKCIIDGKDYEIKSSVNLVNRIGCYLAKNNEGYFILCYEEDNLRVIKKYDSLKSEKIQARLSEERPDGAKRFLVRIGLNKFVVDVNNNKLSFVMDLC